MRAFFVVVDQPLPGMFAHIVKRVEEVGLQHFVAEAAVEAFDISVLRRFAGLDVMELYLMGFIPRDELA